jgi:hypothetical protein
VTEIRIVHVTHFVCALQSSTCLFSSFSAHALRNLYLAFCAGRDGQPAAASQ